MGKFNFGLPGIQKITIPKQDFDFADTKKAIQVLTKYMPSILSKHRFNRQKILYCRNYALGLQDITEKKRLYNKDSKNNNQITENHAFRQSTFKTGFITSEKRDYAHKSDSKCNDMKYLDRYLTDCDFFAKDKDLKEWVFQTGIGVTYTCPRTDIIVGTKETGFHYKTLDEGFDIEYEAPFTFDVLDPSENFVVYSSVRGGEPLLAVSIVQVEKRDAVANGKPEYEYLLYIESKYARYKAYCDKGFNGFKDIKLELIKSFQDMPMVEHFTNSARLGLVELNRDLFNAINLIVSNTIDLIIDNTNVIMVFKNTDITQELIDDMKNKGALIIKDTQDNKNSSEAKLDIIRVEIPFDGLNSFHEERLVQSYDLAGVPLASGQVTSGGDTGQARLLGGGWNNAYIIIKNDITSLLRGDYAVLKSILKICKEIPSCSIRSITTSQIDIKYHINQSDNLLVKAQSIAQLHGVNLPKEEILKVTGLFSDICSVAQKWETVEKEKTKQAQKLAEQNANNGKTDDGKDKDVPSKNGGDNNVDTKQSKDNNSKE